MKRSTASFNTLGMVSVSQVSGFAGSVSSLGRPAGRSANAINKRRNTLTLTDLEASEPFEKLKNIDKPPKSKSDEPTPQLERRLPQSAQPENTRVSFSGEAGHGGVRQDKMLEALQSLAAAHEAKQGSTQQPVTSYAPGRIDVKSNRPTQEPVTSSLPGYTDTKPKDVRRSTQEPVKSYALGQTDVKQYDKPTLSSLLGYTDTKPKDVKRSTQEPVTSSLLGYTDTKPKDVKRSTQEPVTSSSVANTDCKLGDVRRNTLESQRPSAPTYVDAKPNMPRTHEPMTSSLCAYIDIKPGTKTSPESACIGNTTAEQPPGNGRFPLGMMTMIINDDDD